VATGDLVIPVQNNANGSKLDIAPFWDSMVASDGSDGQLGTLWWEFVEGEVDRIVIQWTNYRFTTSTYNPADLTFQVVLYEDGRFEYRYGKMDGPHEATRARWATIGAQSRDCPSNTCPFGVQLVRQSEQVHGLEGRVYRFDGLH